MISISGNGCLSTFAGVLYPGNGRIGPVFPEVSSAPVLQCPQTTEWFFRCNKKMPILLKPGFGRDQPHRGPFEAFFTVTVLPTEAPK